MVSQKNLKDLKKISEQVSPTVTRLKLLEEAGELIQSLVNDIRNEEEITSSNTVSEMADVVIVLTQILLQDENMGLFKNAMDYKIFRTIKRLEEGYYVTKLKKED